MVLPAVDWKRLIFYINSFLNGSLVSFSCQSYPKSLWSFRVWIFDAWSTLEKLRWKGHPWGFARVQAGSEWCITSVRHFLIPVLADFVSTALAGHFYLSWVTRKAVACGPLRSPGLEGKHPFCCPLCALGRSGRIHLSVQHSVGQPREPWLQPVGVQEPDGFGVPASVSTLLPKIQIQLLLCQHLLIYLGFTWSVLVFLEYCIPQIKLVYLE